MGKHVDKRLARTCAVAWGTIILSVGALSITGGFSNWEDADSDASSRSEQRENKRSDRAIERSNYTVKPGKPEKSEKPESKPVANPEKPEKPKPVVKPKPKPEPEGCPKGWTDKGNLGCFAPGAEKEPNTEEPQEDDPSFDCRFHGNEQCGVNIHGTWYVIQFNDGTPVSVRER